MSDRRPRSVESILLPKVGSVREVPELAVGVEMVDAAGAEIAPVRAYLHSLAAGGCSAQTCRSYALALLRWWRFLAAIEVDWGSAGRDEFVDYIVWMRTAVPAHGSGSSKSRGYAPRTINHSSAVLAGFYEFHARLGSGPMLNPTAGHGPRQNAHHNPMQPFRRGSRLLGRQKIPLAAPKSLPDTITDELFAKLRHNRDRALVAMFLSTGARATELLTVTADGLDFGNSRIEVDRKGGRGRQWLPASPDAFVWLRLALGQRRLSAGDPVWLALRSPFAPLSYPACRKVFLRAQEELGTKYTLHQLRHTAAYRMVEDPDVSITDVQWVLGHSHLTTTQIYTQARPEDVLERMAEHHRKRSLPSVEPAPVATGYDPGSLSTLFGGAM